MIQADEDGSEEGKADGPDDGILDGMELGKLDGSLEGILDGMLDGSNDGILDGMELAKLDGSLEGILDELTHDMVCPAFTEPFVSSTSAIHEKSDASHPVPILWIDFPTLALLPSLTPTSAEVTPTANPSAAVKAPS